MKVKVTRHGVGLTSMPRTITMQGLTLSAIINVVEKTL